jgi:hypothetical protein
MGAPPAALDVKMRSAPASLAAAPATRLDACEPLVQLDANTLLSSDILSREHVLQFRSYIIMCRLYGVGGMQLGSRSGGHSIHRASAHINSTTTRRAMCTGWPMRRARSRCSTTPCEPRARTRWVVYAHARRGARDRRSATRAAEWGLDCPCSARSSRCATRSGGEGAGAPVTGGRADPTRCSPTRATDRVTANVILASGGVPKLHRGWWWWVLSVVWCWAAGAYIPPTGL